MRKMPHLSNGFQSTNKAYSSEPGATKGARGVPAEGAVQLSCNRKGAWVGRPEDEGGEKWNGVPLRKMCGMKPS